VRVALSVGRCGGAEGAPRAVAPPKARNADPLRVELAQLTREREALARRVRESDVRLRSAVARGRVRDEQSVARDAELRAARAAAAESAAQLGAARVDLERALAAKDAAVHEAVEHAHAAQRRERRDELSELDALRHETARLGDSLKRERLHVARLSRRRDEEIIKRERNGKAALGRLQSELAAVRGDRDALLSAVRRRGAAPRQRDAEEAERGGEGEGVARTAAEGVAECSAALGEGIAQAGAVPTVAAARGGGAPSIEEMLLLSTQLLADSDGE